VHSPGSTKAGAPPSAVNNLTHETSGTGDDAGETGASSRALTLDVVVPVHDEAAVLAASVTLLHEHLSAGFPYAWQVTVVDNASVDGTAEIAHQLAATLPFVRALRLERKGRGLALRTAWSQSDAAVVAYMDVDLSTGLDALLPLVAPLISGHSDVAIGSRLANGANVARGPKREIVSRSYNLILHGLFGNRFRDAQCGFKALRADVARRLLPQVRDDQWFFDTELLLLAEHNGLRIHELPVDWVDDPDSCVRIARTALDDLKGSARMAWRFATGNGAVDLGGQVRRPLADDLGRSQVVFALVGMVSTLVTVGSFLALRPSTSPGVAVVLALLATSVANSWAHRRWSFGGRGRAGLAPHALASLVLTLVGMVLSVGAVSGVGGLGGGVVAEIAVLLATWGLVAGARFRLFAGVARRARAPRRRAADHENLGEQAA
jgi:putative flippase GtrA